LNHTLQSGQKYNKSIITRLNKLLDTFIHRHSFLKDVKHIVEFATLLENNIIHAGLQPLKSYNLGSITKIFIKYIKKILSNSILKFLFCNSYINHKIFKKYFVGFFKKKPLYFYNCYRTKINFYNNVLSIYQVDILVELLIRSFKNV